jgi:hypothetical protein
MISQISSVSSPLFSVMRFQKDLLKWEISFYRRFPKTPDPLIHTPSTLKIMRVIWKISKNFLSITIPYCKEILHLWIYTMILTTTLKTAVNKISRQFAIKWSNLNQILKKLIARWLIFSRSQFLGLLKKNWFNLLNLMLWKFKSSK